MLESITFKEDCRCFKKGFKIEFSEGVNLLVGGQGTGKSTILETIKGASSLKNVADFEGGGNFVALDFEHDNPRTKGYFDPRINPMAQMGLKWSSHGESNLRLLRDAPSKGMWILDEPDQALSVKSCLELADMIKSRKDQVIASVHSPVVMSAFETVYSTEHRKVMTPKEFVELLGWKGI